MLRRILIALVVVTVLLPAVLVLAYRVVPPPITPLMVIRLAEGQGLTRDWTRLDDIATALAQAVVASEDNLFCEHTGFDWNAMNMVIGELNEGGAPRGASTISMQVAKNLFLWPGRSYVRKAIEAYLTLYIEVLLPKRRIMELYLNIAEWGPGLYGAEAAARHHFGKPAARLTGREAALLAVTLPSPLRWSASEPSGYIANRASVIQRRIGQLGSLLNCVRD